MITIIIPEWLLWIVGILYFIQLAMNIYINFINAQNKQREEDLKAAKDLYQQKVYEHQLMNDN